MLIYGVYLTDRFVSSPLRVLMIFGGAILLCVGMVFYQILKKE